MSSGRELVRYPPSPPMEMVRHVGAAAGAVAMRQASQIARQAAYNAARQAFQASVDGGRAFIDRFYTTNEVPGRFSSGK